MKVIEPLPFKNAAHRAPGPDAAVARLALEAACAMVHRNLGPWLGLDACTRLVHRALAKSAVTYPGLIGAIVMSPKVGVETAGMHTLSPDAARVVEAFLGVLFDQLGSVVGDDVAVRMVTPTNPKSEAVGDPPSGAP